MHAKTLPIRLEGHRSDHQLSQTTVVLICLSTGLSVVPGLLVLLARTAAAVFGIDLTPQLADSWATLYAVWGTVQFLVWPTSWILFLVWVHHAYRNLSSLNVGALSTTPAGTVWGYFIPILSLYQPYRNMKELWLRSRPSSDGEIECVDGPAAIVGWWWFFHLGGGIIGAILDKAFDADGLISAAMEAVRTVLVCSLILGIEARQRARAWRIAMTQP